ncbi:MAG TPA: YbhB/YbcL family Raf kinase inhibitor-like protein [Acetobacteraceae bacterium]|nr:YbhB/YbcL family Raf kinase inhibitor-like protein [Acetobacteraceae bacterium]
MIEGVASKIGQALRNVRPGIGALASSRLRSVPRTLRVTSPAFTDGGQIPARYTQDGEGLFPPLGWESVPATAKSLALLVEDADAPFPRPLVHAVLHGIPPHLGGLPEGALPKRLTGPAPLGFSAGRNSLTRPGWMAPSPMPGHGPHRYAFQLFALDFVPRFAHTPGRTLLMRTIRSHILAYGRLTGVYRRD